MKQHVVGCLTTGHVRGQSVSYDSPQHVTVPQHRWISHAGSGEPFRVARPQAVDLRRTKEKVTVETMKH